jgi:hypothetical protein
MSQAEREQYQAWAGIHLALAGVLVIDLIALSHVWHDPMQSAIIGMLIGWAVTYVGVKSENLCSETWCPNWPQRVR